MGIRASGQALISSADDGTVYSIAADELEWDVVGSDDRSMGLEVLHEASFSHTELGQLSWTVSEYPAEALNHTTEDLNGHLLLEDFHFWYEHHPDEDWYRDMSRGPMEFSSKELEEADPDRQREMLVEWFGSRYHDPAQDTPYDGREGGYQYIHGGPYDARDELEQNFADFVSDETIDAAVDELESEGTMEWAPIRADRPDDSDYIAPPRRIADFDALIDDGARVIPPNAEQERAKQDVLKSAETFLEALRRSQPQHGGMGHNGPPTDDAGHVLPPGFMDELESAAQEIRETVSADDPDIGRVSKAGVVLERRLGWLVRPLPPPPPENEGPPAPKTAEKKPNKFTDAFKEQLATNAANIVTNVAVMGASAGGGFILNAIAPGLDMLVGSILTYLALRIKH